MYFFLPMSIPIFLILFVIYLRIVFGGSEDAIIHQGSKPGNTTDRIATFKLKCAKHSYMQGSIHHRVYDEDILHVFKIHSWYR